MKCLEKYKWVKLPRKDIPSTKGLMGSWMRLAASVAYRNGQAKYCGYVNEVEAGTWVGGIVGVKSILIAKTRSDALSCLDRLATLHYIAYHIDQKTKRLILSIADSIIFPNTPDAKGGVYAREKNGFICIPRDITQRLVDNGIIFEDADAWLDLWCHTVYHDPKNAFSGIGPVIQYGKNGIVLALSELGNRWRWSKVKVSRFLSKHSDTYALIKLPGAYGSLIYNLGYPAEDQALPIPSYESILRIIDALRNISPFAQCTISDHHALNRIAVTYSRTLYTLLAQSEALPEENRVSHSAPITRAYCSQKHKRWIDGSIPQRNIDWEWCIKPRFTLFSALIRGPCLKSEQEDHYERDFNTLCTGRSAHNACNKRICGYAGPTRAYSG